MRVCVIGLGYIGLPTALVIAEHSIEVIGVDINANRLESIQHNTLLMHEHEFNQRLQRALESTHFRVQSEPCCAEIFIICVPTPFKENNRADLSYVWQAFLGLFAYLKKGDCIIVESTIAVGTMQALADYIHTHTSYRVGSDIYLAYCPERVIPGKIFKELINNKRVIGGITPSCAQKAKAFYQRFVHAQCIECTAQEAEMVKLVENSFRDVNLAFAHQLAAIAQESDLDVYRIIELANHHPRVSILNPSAGVGGHCIAVDPWFLIETSPEQSSLLSCARAINDQRPFAIANRLKAYAEQWYQQHSKPLVLVLMGLTYKPDVDDIRESPALLIAQQLSGIKTIELQLCDPYVYQQSLPGILNPHFISIGKDLSSADAIVYLVKHHCFLAIEEHIKPQQKIFDYCGIRHTQAVTLSASERSLSL